LGVIAQEQSPPTPANSSFQISGTVVDALSGQTLAGARVIIASTTRPAKQTVTTGADGRFRFTNVAPGKYSLVAQRRGFPLQFFDAHEFYSTAIAVGPGKASDGLVFRLKPDNSITGMVTDDYGEPVRRANVMLFGRRVQNGELTTFGASATATDDQGIYHFGHLQPGTYFISVSAQPWYAQHVSHLNGQPAQDDPALDVAYPLTYYPSAISPDGASPIELHLGDRVNADITMTAVPALHIRLANLTADPSKVVQPVLLERQLGDFQLPVPAQVERDSSGEYELEGVAPGRYEIELLTFNPKNGARSERRRAFVDITSSGQLDAAQTSGAATVKGTLQFEGEPGQNDYFWLQFRESSGRVEDTRALAQGEFDPVPLSPGRYEVLLGSSERWIVKSISASGAKVSGRTLEITSSDPVQLTVVATKGVGRVNGTALRGKKPVAGAMVVLVPEDIVNNTSLVRRDQSDSDGTFTLPAVLPGKYTVLAIADGWQLEWSNPAILQKYLTKGQPLEVQANGKYDVEVQVQ
jgi:protocatechuate 3,4-dioxygenase beta subunit